MNPFNNKPINVEAQRVHALRAEAHADGAEVRQHVVPAHPKRAVVPVLDAAEPRDARVLLPQGALVAPVASKGGLHAAGQPPTRG